MGSLLVHVSAASYATVMRITTLAYSFSTNSLFSNFRPSHYLTDVMQVLKAETYVPKSVVIYNTIIVVKVT
jgi:hypothetical protein